MIFWRALCCSPLHYQIYLIIVNYRDSVLTKEEAKESLLILDICSNESYLFRESVVELYNQIVK
jgi:hypothetical protein